ncbi:LysR family transcriptional regulator [Erwinia sorbitola]|uniref:LysR family transcriptional regulator n=1 Tax=Erwinia sorbitola TaxID=2681984 RepID=A0A6I6EQW7_9GAMM|nr:LysR family transcriptional regulator [Erwinia sorbitola]MTD25981.1 LysR family transcriptional regulator [Erwinia sorbitola]QGU87479.1 LysR family transcriptional regulator [Erwinia sorbitola]
MHSSEIRYFLAVVNSGSLSAASQQLFVAVSAISRQIQRLEARVGAPLFERHARGMVLNDAGQIFENHVRKSMMDMEHAIAEIKGLKAIRRTALRVACTEGMAFSLLPVLCTQFRLLHPGVSFHLTVASAQQVTEIMRRGECDVAFQFSLHPERGVEVVAAWPAPVLLVMHQSHPLAQRQVQLSDLLTWPLALPDAGTTVRQLFDLSCRMSGTFVEPTLTCNNFSTLYQFLLQTPGAITICSQFTVMYQAAEHGLTLKSVGADQLSQRSLQVQTAIGRTPGTALALFLDFVRHELTQKDESIRTAFNF